jgi:hypothetical protein
MFWLLALAGVAFAAARLNPRRRLGARLKRRLPFRTARTHSL